VCVLNYQFAMKLKVCLKMDSVGVLMIDSNSSGENGGQQKPVTGPLPFLGDA